MWQEEKEEEKRLKRTKHKEQPVAKWLHQHQEGAIKASRLVLFWILLGTRMQVVRAVEEISIRQEVDHTIETVHAVLEVNSRSLRRIPSFEGRWEKLRRGNSQEKDPRTIEENRGRGPQNTQKETARVRTREPLKKTFTVGTRRPLKEAAGKDAQALLCFCLRVGR